MLCGFDVLVTYTDLNHKIIYIKNQTFTNKRMKFASNKRQHCQCQ